jgi:hypothetical protein
MPTRSVILVAVLTPCFFIQGQGSAETPIGFVSRLKGEWIRLSDGKVLKEYDELYPGTRVSTDRSNVNAIQVALFNGGTWEWDCTKRACTGKSQPVMDGASQDERGFLQFLTTYFRGPKFVPGVFAAGRSNTRIEPRACIVAPRSGSVDLSPCLEGLGTASYQVELVALRETSAPLVATSITWPGSTSIKIPRNLSTGAYALSRSSPAR